MRLFERPAKEVEQEVFIRDFCSSGKEITVHDKHLQFPYRPKTLDEDPSDRAPGTHFRWIHIPVNDTTMVEECVDLIAGPYPKDFLKNTWRYKVRPAGTVPEHIVPDHARCMEPSFEVHNKEASRPNSMDQSGSVGRRPYQPLPDEEDLREMERDAPFTVFLPYLSWEKYSRIKSIQEEDTSDGKQPRRTLDQFFYTGLKNTRSRDAGQTVSKWTGNGIGMQEDGREKAVEDSLVVMVDQLWIWVLDHETLVSCFPSGNSLAKTPSAARPGAKSSGFTDVLTVAKNGWGKCWNLYDLTGLLVMSAVTNIFLEKNTQSADLLAIYRWASANKAARHTELLEAFEKRQFPQDAIEGPTEGAKELNLILELADILDELNILQYLLETQDSVIASLYEGKFETTKPTPKYGFPKEYARVYDVQPAPATAVREDNGRLFVQKVGRRLNSEKRNLKRLRAETSQSQRMLLELLDLKQKAASLEEARSTTKQGQAIMLFTVVTIIFLPLSFITSFLGQNVSEITGDDKNPTSAAVWRIAGPVSVGLIMLALVIAFYIMNPRSFNFPWRRRRVSLLIDG